MHIARHTRERHKDTLSSSTGLVETMHREEEKQDLGDLSLSLSRIGPLPLGI
jgi:hypothetical protein